MCTVPSVRRRGFAWLRHGSGAGVNLALGQCLPLCLVHDGGQGVWSSNSQDIAQVFADLGIKRKRRGWRLADVGGGLCVGALY